MIEAIKYFRSTLFVLWFSPAVLAGTGIQDVELSNPIDSCRVLQSITPRNTHVFYEGGYATIKFKDNQRFNLARINRITRDSIELLKREFIEGKPIYKSAVVYHINEVKWINWDGVPRKKIRTRFHDLYVVNRCLNE